MNPSKRASGLLSCRLLDRKSRAMTLRGWKRTRRRGGVLKVTDPNLPFSANISGFFALRVSCALQVDFRETLCESGRWIDALKKRGVLKKRGRVLKKTFSDYWGVMVLTGNC